MRKLTTQEFIDRARAVHGNKYNYDFVVYQSAREKVIIKCIKHGLFYQKSTSHLSGSDCPKCVVDARYSNTENFVTLACKIHNDKYDYSLVDYFNNSTKVSIVCKEHGVFSQIPSNHLIGHSCVKCSSDKTSKRCKSDNISFIEKAEKVHGKKYDYSKASYICNSIKLIITCCDHGDHKITPAAHLSGQGCPGCAKSGFDRTRKAYIYVLRSNCGSYMKIGITHNPKQRHTKLKRDTPFSFKRIELIEGLGEQIARLEKELLAEYQPAEFDSRFDGYSEWRLWDSGIRHKLLTSKIQG